MIVMTACCSCVMTLPSLRKRNDSAAEGDTQKTHCAKIHEINTRANRNQVATSLLFPHDPITLLLRRVMSSHLYIHAFSMCDSIAVLHYVS